MSPSVLCDKSPLACLQTRPRPQALKPPILLVAQDESRLVAVIQRCTAFEDEVAEHKKKTEEEEELEVRWWWFMLSSYVTLCNIETTKKCCRDPIHNEWVLHSHSEEEGSPE